MILLEHNWDTEVGQLHLSVFIGQDIAAFYVPVDHPLRVQVMKALKDLLDVNDHQSLWDLPNIFNQKIKRPNLYKLKDDVEVVIGLYSVVVFDDFGVIKSF